MELERYIDISLNYFEEHYGQFQIRDLSEIIYNNKQFCFSFSIEERSCHYAGIGVDGREDVAAAKSISECFERIKSDSFIRVNEYQNIFGTAFHFDEQVSREKALLEYDERRYLHQILLSSSNNDQSLKIKNRISKLNKNIKITDYYFRFADRYLLITEALMVLDENKYLGNGFSLIETSEDNSSELEAIRRLMISVNEEKRAKFDIKSLLSQKSELNLAEETFSENNKQELKTSFLENVGYFTIVKGSSYPFLTKDLSSQLFFKNDIYSNLSQKIKLYINNITNYLQ